MRYKSTAVQIHVIYMYRYGTEKINNEMSHRIVYCIRNSLTVSLRSRDLRT
jgi:hypothetical protein